MRRRQSLPRVAALLSALAALAFASVATAPGSAAQERRVVVVGDSIILGAKPQIEAAFARSGWATTFDADVSRSTPAGATAIRAHAGELTDSLVISLGANDAGNTETFRQRVAAVMDAAGATPHVYWLTIREVRPYYGPANQVLRDAAARYPNLEVIDWHAASAGAEGLTSGDGLHLTNAGANAMAFVVASQVAAGASPLVAPPTTAAPAPTTAPAPVATLPAPADAAPTTVPAEPTTTVPPTTAVPTTIAPTTTVVDSAIDATGERTSATSDDDGDGLGVFDTIGLGLLGVVLALGIGGAWIAVWSLLRTRGRATTAPDGPVATSMSRRDLRARRIADSRSHHPTRRPPATATGSDAATAADDTADAPGDGPSSTPSASSGTALQS